LRGDPSFKQQEGSALFWRDAAVYLRGLPDARWGTATPSLETRHNWLGEVPAPRNFGARLARCALSGHPRGQ
jgi:hypothetical protein